MSPQTFSDLPEDDEPVERERMWPLDAALVALGGLILYLAIDRLEFDDPRWQHNAWTYVVLIPTVIAATAFLLHKLTGKFFQRSVQLGFLVSVFVHLLLMIVAVNVVIFSRYFPDTFTGFQPDRAPIRKTVPDRLFQQQNESTQQADWAKPVDAETASRIVPEEMRELPPQERVAPRLELPTEEPQKELELKKYLIERQRAEETMPSPKSNASKLARRDSQEAPQVTPSIEIPEVPSAEEAPQREPERTTAQAQRAAAGAAFDLPIPDPQQQPSAPERQVEFRRLEETPRTGETVVETPQRREIQRRERMSPAGAAPMAPSYSVAQNDPEASHILRPDASPATRATDQRSPSLAELGLTGPAPQSSDLAMALPGAANGPPIPQTGMPQVSSSRIARSSGRAAMDRANAPPLPLGPPKLDARQSVAESAMAASGANDGPQRDQTEGPARRNLDALGGPALALAPLSPAITADDGPVGLAMERSPRTGFQGMPDIPSTSTLGLGPRPVDRKKVGGPMTPAGSEVASVESFQQRVMRTSGGAAPAPEGMVGPETEQAIELGLAYLADRQNPDGSWSLGAEQGERVLLHSDTAATGMALLAFQGAGYTHRQHQYASVLAKGFGFLLKNQRENGDLFRREDALSNQNVWLYSHAIAALALCEAYGMTQDPELEEPAQRAIDFIAASQHPTRGGWRYRPRNSSDTSVSGWMMMALKSGELSGLHVAEETYEGIDDWLRVAQEGPSRGDRYRYNPYAPNNDAQRHGREVTRTMTAVGMLMRMYSGWERDNPMMQSAADFIAAAPPAIGQPRRPLRDTYYWYYATQVMFHMGGEYWDEWNRVLTPLLVDSQEKAGEMAGSWDPRLPVPDRWSPHGGRLYVTAMNLLSLEVYYRHLPIYEETAR